MERHTELIFAILAWREGQDSIGGVAAPKLNGWTLQQVCYHAELARQAGFLASYDHTLSGDGAQPQILHCRIGPLTNAGHDELQRMRTSRQ